MSKILRSLLLTLFCIFPLAAKAQVTPDGTTDTNVTQEGDNFAIEQGDRVGDNLFHSFEQFSIPTGGSAGFNNAESIANIFSRVTGGNISNIDGLLSANGTANLFLINPNGIIFGENARLDIGGSFYGSTADSLLFDGDTEFSAVNPQAAPLLEVSIPIGLSFRDNPGDITASPGSVLGVDSGQNLALIGGNISFDNAIVTGSPSASGNTIELASVAEAGIINFGEDIHLEFSDRLARNDISITNNSIIDVISRGEGAINIYAKNFTLGADSLVSSGVLLDSDTDNARSGDIVINATEDVIVDATDSENLTSIFNNVVDTTGGTTNGTGQGGNIEISARNISLINGGTLFSQVSNLNENRDNANQNRSSNIILNAENNISIESNTFSSSRITNSVFAGEGDGGAIQITAQNLSVAEGGIIISLIREFAEGTAGNINLDIDNLNLSSGGEISSIAQTSPTETTTENEFGQRNGGNIDISANVVSIDGSGSSISSSTLTDGISQLIGDLAQGNAGDITVSTNSLSITNGGRIEALSESLGDGGDIQIVARDSVSVDGGAETRLTLLQNNTGSFFNNSGLGNAGNLIITTPEFIVANNGFVSATTFNQGNAGNLTISASDSVIVDNDGQIIADAFFRATGKGGNLNIETANLSITGGGQISASTLGAADAGNLTIDATDSIRISGAKETFASGLFVVAFNGEGKGGELSIATQDLSIADGGTINVGNFPNLSSSQSPGSGEPGNLSIQADSIRLENGALINASTRSPVGDGANINILSEGITLDNNALISARAFEEADGGNLSIDSGFILAFPDGNNDIVARAEQGNGGRISIDTEAIFGLEEGVSEPDNLTNDIDASSEFGLQGDFTLNTPDFDPTSGLLELPAAVGDASDQISQNPCQQGVGSEFIVTGKGGLPTNPNESLGGNGVEVGLVEPSDLTDSSNASRKKKDNVTTEAKSTPAQGWVVSEKGEVTLTAYAGGNQKVNRTDKQVDATCSNLK